MAADIRPRGADSPVRPRVYFAAGQGLLRSMSWAIEADGPPTALVEPVRFEIQSLDPNLPAYNVASLEAVIEEELGGDTIMAKIMAIVALIALVLSLAGVYGVMAHSVSQRTQELGIRMALGARERDLLAMVVRQGAALGIVGVLIGVGVSLGTTRSLSVFLHGVSPFDVRTYAAVALALFGAGIVATYFPARRATKVDPLVALRAE